MNELLTKFEEVRLVYRNKMKVKDRPKVQCANDAFNILYNSWDKDQIDNIEESKLLLLDRQMRLMSLVSLSFGGMTEAIIDPRVVFATALKRRANGIILAHNHPSGNLEPSQADISLTERFKSLGEMMRISLLDHLIVTFDGFRSIVSNESGGIHHG
ncbi:MAG: JAB domain-containing protein [Cyclobacteriaceae bacterium]|jgi:DNA repair protein RadC|tara:strand:+ start:1506 stop:1976 length:471 start_codon:yes stop_codon:yes gene_type:complete